MSAERPSDRELLEAVLANPGSTGESYRRFWNYSTRNLGMLALYGCPPEPVATFNRWKDLGRWVKKGSKAFPILRPIMVRKKDDKGEPTDEFYQCFKVVRSLFPYSMTEGDELPPYEPPEWSRERALANLAITEVAFESYNGNVGGYAVGRTIAINPVAPNPLRTTLHECAHVECGHTEPDTMDEYAQHRGRFETEAELTAYVSLKEIGAMDAATDEISRGYSQSWNGNNRLEDGSVSKVMTSSTKIVAAGYETVETFPQVS